MLSRFAGLQSGQHAQASLLSLLGVCDIPQQLTAYPYEFVNYGLLPSTWVRLVHSYP